MNETQQEELEVLKAIYEGDVNFKEISKKIFQYKIGDDGDLHSFLLEIRWPQDYPEKLPDINLNAFYNKHVSPGVKEEIISKITEQAEGNIGLAMTFTLFEYCKENLETLMAGQTNIKHSQSNPAGSAGKRTANNAAERTKEKKEHLTKAQKRRLFDRFGTNEERPRGWDWVDVVKHLSKTGSSVDS